MIEQLEELKLNAFRELEGIGGAGELESWRVRYLGKKSELTRILRSLSQLPLEERKTVGAHANQTRVQLQESLSEKEQALRDSQLAEVAWRETIDATLPGYPYPVGGLHPIAQTINEIYEIFMSMGFQVVEAPEVEWDYYNFEALNIPKEHPARDTMATLWVDSETGERGREMLLRTHTSAGDARFIETMELPIRVVNGGKVYRYEASDATHSPMFHQINGLAVDKGVTMSDLKGTLYEFAHRFFGKDRKVRFRCDFFPFVEPGVEMAIDCLVCNGTGCRLCSGSGWIEILGAGMSHPNMLARAGIDPEVYASFAFGLGIERLTMLRYGIDDIRLFFNSDLRFLRQFQR